jgi:hypothetical protein
MVTSTEVLGLDHILLGRTIRILFYADHRDSNYQTVPQPGSAEKLRGQPTEFGLRIAKDLLESQSGLFLRFKVDVLNRHHDYDATGAVQDFDGPVRVGKHKLTRDLLRRYDQVWFFGQLYANYSGVLRDYGNRESELTDDEVSALRDWMDAGGGVLMTGDHSNDVKFAEGALMDPTLVGQQLNLGRALGHRVPRAGAMRVWVGDPGASRTDNYIVDTTNDLNMAMMPKQEDATPQSIRVAQVAHRIALAGLGALQLNPLFFYDDHPLFKAQATPEFPRSVIDILPDHTHEGAVAIPSSFDPAVWPRAGNAQPKPQVVAWGTNWAARNYAGARSPFDAVLRLHPEVAEVAAYDGDRVGVGRIVAHSTWHHFVNVNLVGFRNPDGTPGTVLERIGTYYRNLALWLSPEKERASVIFDAIKWAARHPLVREVHGGPPPLVGQTAANLLVEVLGVGVYAELMQLPFSRVPTAADLLTEDGPSDGGLDTDRLPTSVAHELVLGLAIEHVAREPAGHGHGNEVEFGEATFREITAKAVMESQRRFVLMGRSMERLAKTLV